MPPELPIIAACAFSVFLMGTLFGWMFGHEGGYKLGSKNGYEAGVLNGREQERKTIGASYDRGRSRGEAVELGRVTGLLEEFYFDVTGSRIIHDDDDEEEDTDGDE